MLKIFTYVPLSFLKTIQTCSVNKYWQHFRTDDCLRLALVSQVDFFAGAYSETADDDISSLNSQKYLYAFGVILRKTKLKFDEQ